MPKRAFYIGLIALLASLGCGTDSTEQQRANLSPQTVALLTQTRQAFDGGAYRQALLLADSAVAEVPNFADAHFLRAAVLTGLNRFDEAEVAYQRVLELDPLYQTVHFNLGNNAFRQRRFSEALAQYRQEQVVVGDLIGRDLSFAPEHRRGALAPVFLQMGRTWLKTATVDSARWAYEQALALDSTYAEAYGDLARLLGDEGEVEDALRLARRAVELEPESADYQYLTGQFLLQSGETEAAVPHLEASVARRPWYHGALYNLGQAYLRLGHTEAAQPYLDMADSLQALGQDIERTRLAVRHDPESIAGWLKLADQFIRARRFDEAVQPFETVLALQPGNLLVRNDRANLALVLGDTATAVNQYQTIIAYDSTFADAWANLGVVHAVSGQMAQARLAWGQALKHDPNHPVARENLIRLDARE